MGFQQRARTPRDFDRRTGRNKSKTKFGKRLTGREDRLEDEHVATLTEVVDKTLNGLNRLGNQRFAVPPFHEHYDRWLLSIRNILSEFELNHGVATDDRFREESSRVLADIDTVLKERRFKEIQNNEAVRRVNRSLLDARSLLGGLDREYAVKMNEIAGKREHAIKPFVTSLGRVREELNRIVRMRAGFLRGISRKAKAERANEATKKLDSTRKELARIEQSFASEQQKLRSEYERSRREILQQVANDQKEIERLESEMQGDDALDARQAACKALTASVSSLLQRAPSTKENLSRP